MTTWQTGVGGGPYLTAAHSVRRDMCQITLYSKTYRTNSCQTSRVDSCVLFFLYCASNSSRKPSARLFTQTGHECRRQCQLLQWETVNRWFTRPHALGIFWVPSRFSSRLTTVFKRNTSVIVVKYLRAAPVGIHVILDGTLVSTRLRGECLQLWPNHLVYILTNVFCFPMKAIVASPYLAFVAPWPWFWSLCATLSVSAASSPATCVYSSLSCASSNDTAFSRCFSTSRTSDVAPNLAMAQISPLTKPSTAEGGRSAYWQSAFDLKPYTPCRHSTTLTISCSSRVASLSSGFGGVLQNMATQGFFRNSRFATIRLFWDSAVLNPCRKRLRNFYVENHKFVETALPPTNCKLWWKTETKYNFKDCRSNYVSWKWKYVVVQDDRL